MWITKFSPYLYHRHVAQNCPPASSYRYVYFDQPKFAIFPRLTVTRRSLDIAVRISTLIFTLIYSTSLYLLTTAPEEITAGLEDLMSPLRRFQSAH